MRALALTEGRIHGSADSFTIPGPEAVKRNRLAAPLERDTSRGVDQGRGELEVESHYD